MALAWGILNAMMVTLFLVMAAAQHVNSKLDIVATKTPLELTFASTFDNLQCIYSCQEQGRTMWSYGFLRE